MPAHSPLLEAARHEPRAARARILAALAAADGNRTHAAAALGVSRGLLLRCAELCGATAVIAQRWPGSERGGGTRGPEHAAAVGRGRAAAWAKARQP